MRTTVYVALAASAAAMLPAGAQQDRVWSFDRSDAPHRAALGVSTTATGTPRDTLGVMITAITPGSPAEKAGLEEGNRLAAINGVSLRASAADIEDVEMSGALTRRLNRELAKAKPGDEVELRVYRDGRTTSMKIRAADSDSLFRRRAMATTRLTRAALDDRPAIGISLGSAGSRRDTLGVLVIGVGDSTPAARAGIEEGNRIAAINSVNLRVAAADAGDRELGGLRARQLQREIQKLKAGDDVTLRVYADGRFRDVRLKLARAGDLPRDSRMTRTRGMAPSAPSELRFELGPEFRQGMDQLRREIELLGPELEAIGPALDRMRPELERLKVEVPRAIREARAAYRGSVDM